MSTVLTSSRASDGNREDADARELHLDRANVVGAVLRALGAVADAFKKEVEAGRVLGGDDSQSPLGFHRVLEEAHEVMIGDEGESA